MSKLAAVYIYLYVSQGEYKGCTSEEISKQGDILCPKSEAVCSGPTAPHEPKGYWQWRLSAPRRIQTV